MHQKQCGLLEANRIFPFESPHKQRRCVDEGLKVAQIHYFGGQLRDGYAHALTPVHGIVEVKILDVNAHKSAIWG